MALPNFLGYLDLTQRKKNTEKIQILDYTSTELVIYFDVTT
jgi:hypothetical protein